MKLWCVLIYAQLKQQNKYHYNLKVNSVTESTLILKSSNEHLLITVNKRGQGLGESFGTVTEGAVSGT